jgi:diguanylate cyclase (GGDEF)-like protein
LAFAAYCLIQGALLLAALLVRHPATGAICLTVATVGTLVFIVGVARHRPAPMLGWWLIATSAVAGSVAAFAVAAHNGLRESIVIASPLAIGLGAVSCALLAAGLAVLGRRSDNRAETADRVDAGMAAAGSLLLLWLFVTEPVAPAKNGWYIAGAILFPVGTLLVFVTAVKIALSYGPRPSSVLLVVLAAGASVVAGVAMLLPAIHTGLLTAHPLEQVVWATHGGLLGAAALHPSFVHVALGPGLVANELSRWRILLFAVLAVLVPTVIAIDLVDRPTNFDRTVTGVAVPTAAAAGLLLLLVGRMALVARVSQRRARELADRSASLLAAASEQEALQRQLADQALHDPLTGLSNRVVLAERLEWALSHHSGDAGHALLLLDLDGFKDINDTFGHPVGDQVLIDAAHRLLITTPGDSVVARLGGDEFAILLENTAQLPARAIVEQILDAIRRPFDIGGRQVFLSASIGVFMTDPHDETVARFDVLRDADLALYAAKRAGKNRFVVFDPLLRRERMERSGVGAGLRSAVSHGEVYLHYQPIVMLATGDIVAVEALARWRPPGGDFISPDVFIPIAEETGLINAVGARVLHQACHEARRWYQENGVAVSVNVSAHQLDDPGFADMVTNALSEADLPGSALVLELTERNLVPTAREQPAIVQLERLRAHGIRIAIDDFGTGYSSLAYIARMPVDIVKLDKSFIQRDGSGSGRMNWAFTDAILQAIGSLGLQAIAEGVETAEQADALRSLRCPLAQGYHFARPAPAATIDEALGVSATSGEPPPFTESSAADPD